MKISKHPTQLFFAALFSMALASCSGGSDSGTKTTTQPPTPPPPAPNTPVLELSPETEFNFGEITVGNTAEPLILTITNLDTATASLEISSISLPVTDNFKLNTSTGNATCLTASPVLNKGESCTVEVTFEPKAIGLLTATLTIQPIDSNTPAQQLALSGTSTEITELNVTINQVEADRTAVGTCPANPLKVAAIVSVTDQAGFPVKSLKSGDFIITENPAPATATVLSATPVASASEPLFLSILMDYSESMDPIDLEAMESQAIKMVEQLQSSDKVAIIKFNKDTYTFDFDNTMIFKIDEPDMSKDDLVSFSSDPVALKAAIKTIDGMNSISGTAYLNALELGINDVKIAEDADEASNPRKAVILITDGVDTDSSSRFTLNKVIANAINNEVPVYTVGIAAGSKSADLQRLARETSASFYKANVSENLATIFQQQLAALLFSDQYVVKYNSENPIDSDIDITINASKTGVPVSGTGTDIHTRGTTLCPPPL